jgi:hypothetical protein
VYGRVGERNREGFFFTFLGGGGGRWVDVCLCLYRSFVVLCTKVVYVKAFPCI